MPERDERYNYLANLAISLPVGRSPFTPIDFSDSLLEAETLSVPDVGPVTWPEVAQFDQLLQTVAGGAQ
jgi:hypothetical protein